MNVYCKMLYSLAETKDSTSSTYSDNMDDNYITKVGRMIVQNGISCCYYLAILKLAPSLEKFAN
jgi:hypothetical protein